MKLHSIVRFSVILTLLISIASCGKNRPKTIKDIKVNSYYENSDVFISVDAKLNFGAMQLPQISLPIINPKGGGNLGHIEMGLVAGGDNYLKLAFNLSSVTPLQAVGAKLPNGGTLPLIAHNKVVEINIGRSKSIKLYISFVDGAYALGVAVPIKSFDGIGSTVGTTSVFPIFNINQVIGAVGVFTSSQSGKNGFGLFTDLTNVIDDLMKRDIRSDVNGNKRSVSRRSRKGLLNYSSQATSSRKQKRIDKGLYKLHRKRSHLIII
jgi:hypothetical protein